jgi:hypothetical protein
MKLKQSNAVVLLFAIRYRHVYIIWPGSAGSYEGASERWHCSDGCRGKNGMAGKEEVACTTSQSFQLTLPVSRVFLSLPTSFPGQTGYTNLRYSRQYMDPAAINRVRLNASPGYTAEYICLFVCSYNMPESVMSTCVFSCRPKYSFRENRSAYKVFMWLVIRNFGSSDIGTYNCVSTNSLGRAEGTLRLYGESECRWKEPTLINRVDWILNISFL